jgi:hypothetical protein
MFINDAVKQCLKIVLAWLADYLKPESQQKLIALERKDAGRNHLIRFKRNTPGEVASWNISVTGYNAQMLIFLDSISRLQFLSDRYKAMAVVPGFEQSRSVKRTHLISVEWVVKLKSGKKVAARVGYWIADLQGNNPDPDAKAFDIVKRIALEIYRIEEFTEDAWKRRLQVYPWDNVIADICSSELPKTNPRLKRVDISVKLVSGDTQVKF